MGQSVYCFQNIDGSCELSVQKYKPAYSAIQVNCPCIQSPETQYCHGFPIVSLTGKL